MARKKGKAATVRSKKDLNVLVGITGQEDLSKGSMVSIQDGYLARERYENLVEQGLDPLQHGFAQVREKSGFGRREIAIRKFDWDMEKLEAKRVNYNPFLDKHLDVAKEKEERMEERAEVVAKNTESVFVSRVEMKLADAKFTLMSGQKYKGDEFLSEWHKIEVTNDDLDVRRIFWISAKEAMEINFETRKYQEFPIEKGELSLERTEHEVKFSINGKARTYKVKGTMSLTEEVAKTVKVSKDPFAQF